MWLRPNTWESFLSAHILLYPTPTAANSVFPVFKMTPASTPPHPQHLHCYHPWSVSLPPPLPHVIPLPQTQWVLMFSDGPYRGSWGCTCLHHLSNFAIKPCTHVHAHECTHTHTHTTSLLPFPSLTLATNKPCISHQGASALSLLTVCYVLLTGIYTAASLPSLWPPLKHHLVREAILPTPSASVP